MEDLALDDALERVCAEAVLRALLEGLVEVRAGRRPSCRRARARGRSRTWRRSCLPATRSSPSSLSSQPDSADEQRGGGGDGESSPLRHAARDRTGQGAGRPSRRPCAAASTPRATPSHEQRSRVIGHQRRARRARAAPRAPRARRPRAAASSRHRARRRARSRAAAAPPRARPRRASRRPRRGPSGRATTGSAPQAAASAATMPNASGNVLGHDQRLGGGQQVGQLVVLEPPGPRDALRQRGGRAE